MQGERLSGIGFPFEPPGDLAWSEGLLLAVVGFDDINQLFVHIDGSRTVSFGADDDGPTVLEH
jgi:hypothetical protein